MFLPNAVLFTDSKYVSISAKAALRTSRGSLGFGLKVESLSCTKMGSLDIKSGSMCSGWYFPFKMTCWHNFELSQALHTTKLTMATFCG